MNNFDDTLWNLRKKQANRIASLYGAVGCETEEWKINRCSTHLKFIYGYHELRIIRSRHKVWVADGWLKSVEITRAPNDYAHPHIHALLFVPGSYFNGHNYIIN